MIPPAPNPLPVRPRVPFDPEKFEKALWSKMREQLNKGSEIRCRYGELTEKDRRDAERATAAGMALAFTFDAFIEATSPDKCPTCNQPFPHAHHE